MRISHLKYLIEVDKHHSISAAAQELYLGQTTLSAIVRSLENELGFRVFNRTRNGVSTTPEGEEALVLAWEICNRFDEIKRIGSQEATASLPVPVITNPTINSALALPLNKAFLELEPNGNLEFIVIAGEKVGPRLIKNDSNIGITYFTEPDYKAYQKIAARYQIHVDVLLKDRLYLLVHRDHPLARRDSIFCDELKDMSFAMLSHYNASESTLAYSKNFGPGNRFTTFSSVALIKQAVLEQNMLAVLSGYAIAHNHSVDNSQLKPLILRNSQKDHSMVLCMIRQSDSNLRYQEKLVVQCVRDYFKNLPPIPFAPK